MVIIYPILYREIYGNLRSYMMWLYMDLKKDITLEDIWIYL